MKKFFVIFAASLVSVSCVKVQAEKNSVRVTIAGIDLVRVDGVELSAPVKQTRQVAQGYSGLEAHTGVDVVVSAAVARGEVVVEAAPEVMDYVVTQVEGDKLAVRIDGRGKRMMHTGKVRVSVPVQRYASLNASSSADIKLPDGYDAGGHVNVRVSSSGDVELGRGFKAYSLNVMASSSGEVEGDVTVQNAVQVTASSSADVKLSGTAASFEGAASSSADIECLRLVCQQAQCSASSSGSVQITAFKTITASASSGGSVRYSGTAALQSPRTSSGGSIRKM